MIIFHEGLPGSGKSYEAAINQIIPALKKGRHVYAYIEGINHEKFAEITQLPLERVIELLHPLTKEQVQDVQVHVANDALVVIDELQDFFPAGKTSLSPGITEFVTQHRHRGLDIVCMGQDHRDCHMLWKRRIDQLITFTKRDAVGQPKAYTWKTFKLSAGKFVPLRSGKGVYDSKYFGLYASHAEGVNSIDDHKDDRTNVFKSSAFTFWLPLFCVILVYSFYYLWGFFHGNGPVQASKTTTQVVTEVRAIEPSKYQPPVSASMPVKPQSQPQSEQPTPKPEPPPTKAREYSNFVEKFLEEYRPRLSAFVMSVDCKKMLAKIDFYQNDRVYQSFTIKQLQDFGYLVESKSYGVLISKNGKQYPVVPWPLDVQQNVPDRNKPALGHPL